jgi:hypothetical protein
MGISPYKLVKHEESTMKHDEERADFPSLDRDFVEQ